MLKRFLLILSGFLIFANCSGSKKEPAPAAAQKKDDPGYVSGLAKMGNLAVDPFAQMAFTFEGNPPPDEIHEMLDSVLTKYGMELTDSNRILAGKTLTSLRKEQGHSEVAILQTMQTAPTNDEKFEDAARRISTGLSQ